MTAEPETLEKLEGTVERIIFANEANGYTVCELDALSGEPHVLVGIMPYLAEGETIQALGKFVVHPTFGRQFKVETYERQLPATESAIFKYLASGIIKGIGPMTAKKIVETYMLDTFDVMENHPEWLADIAGVSPKKAKEIGDNFREQAGMRNVMMFFNEFFGPALSVRIYKELGANAVDMIKENPYVLCERVSGIGFEKADAVARRVGLSKQSEDRIAFGIKYVMTYNAAENGHVYLPLHKLVPTADKLLACGEENILKVLKKRTESGMFVIKDIDRFKCVYTSEMYVKESYIAKKLIALESVAHVVPLNDLDVLIERTELENGLKYESLQRRAIYGAVNNSVFLLTGGPGTGKTTVVRAILRIFETLGLDIALCAPTGRAAKRLSQLSGTEAKTIHRLLEMEYVENGTLDFFRNETNPLESDVVIVDEASMVDIDVMYALLSAMKKSARIVLIGDANQLPPVGAGYIFSDILASDRFTSVVLNRIFRQAEESYIVVNAHTINRGEYLDLSHKDSDFFFLRRENDEDTAKTVVDLCASRLPKRYKMTVYDGIQVVSPSHKGEAGTEMLNARLQSAINPPSPKKRQAKLPRTLFREGDKVMQIKNNYEIPFVRDGVSGMGIFNGEIGIIKNIDPEEEKIVVDFDGKVTTYDYASAEELELAYAVTVHKSQGSEYPIVIIPLYRYTPRLLTRNLLYTAVTRAQAMIILVGDEEVSKAMIDNDRRVKRYTGLRQLLENYENN